MKCWGPFRNDHHQYLSSQLSKNDLILVASFFRNNLAKLLVIAHQSAHHIQASPSFLFFFQGVDKPSTTFCWRTNIWPGCIHGAEFNNITSTSCSQWSDYHVHNSSAIFWSVCHVWQVQFWLFPRVGHM